MRSLDFSSWQAIVSTLLGIVVVSLVAVGIRLAIMNGVQQRHQRQNRQINERLKTLIAAYKTLGGSFTGDLAVDPRHLRDLRDLRLRTPDEAAGPAAALADGAAAAESSDAPAAADTPGADRRRRVRDAVEAALSDVILLGTQEQVRLAAHAAQEMVAGRTVEIAELVVSLRTFIREVLDLDAIPGEVAIPRQGPLRTGGAGGRSGGGAGSGDRGGGRRSGAAAGGGGRGSGGGGAGAGGVDAAAGAGTGRAALHRGVALDGDEAQHASASE